MKAVILTPVGSVVHHNFAHSLNATIKAFPQTEWLSNAGVSDIGAGRNLLLDSFMRMSASVAVWIDGDESWTPQCFAAVLTPIIMGEAEVVAAPYAMKKPGPPRYNFSLRRADCDTEKGYVGPKKMIEGREYARAQFAGTGFLAMSRAAVLRAKEVVPHYRSPMNQTDQIAALFEPMIDEGARYGEDYGACRTFGQVGVEILLALGTKIIHYDGLQRFDTESLDLDNLARWLASKMVWRG